MRSDWMSWMHRIALAVIRSGGNATFWQTPPSTETDVRAVERELDVQLPAVFRRSLQEEAGSVLLRWEARVDETEPWWRGAAHWGLDCLAAVTADWRESRGAGDVLPWSVEGREYLAFDLSVPDRAPVILVSRQWPERVWLAPDFSSFLSHWVRMGCLTPELLLWHDAENRMEPTGELARRVRAWISLDGGTLHEPKHAHGPATEQLRTITDTASAESAKLTSDRATRHTLVMPFLLALGYEESDITLDCVEDGRAIDVAIVLGDVPVIVVECRPAGTDLAREVPTRLRAFFDRSDATRPLGPMVRALGVLTNGVDYQLYMNIESTRRLGDRPFLAFALTESSNKTRRAIDGLAKQNFTIERAVAVAADARLVSRFKFELAKQWHDPSDDLVKCLASRVDVEVDSDVETSYLGEMLQRAVRECSAEWDSDPEIWPQRDG